MQCYLNKAMGELAAELSAGLLRLRKGYVDAAEALLQIVEPSQEYPYDFIVYRLTGFRGSLRELPAPLSGKNLRADLLKLMLDVSESFTLGADDYSETTYDIESLAKKMQVSTKTIQRWRRAGLPARRMTLRDGKGRIAFLESSVEWFARERQKQLMRSIKFSQVSPQERRDIIRRAYRMAAFTRCSLTEVARRIAARSGRAVETIRYTLRRHDLENPEQAIFPYLSAPLKESEKEIVYRCFLQGVSVPALAGSYRRTRGSIYRIINEMRAKQLLQRPIEYIYNPLFDHPDAEAAILEPSQYLSSEEPAAPPLHTARSPADLPPYLRSLYDIPLLSAPRERDLFRRYNYLKYRADKLRRQINVNHIRTSQLKQVEMLLLQANMAKNEIVRANLRLVVSIAKKHLHGPQTLFELISDGNISLMHAADKFDYSRGNRFSTYASWAIMRNFARSVPQERYLLDRFETGNEEAMDLAGSLKAYDPDEVNLSELRESIDVVMAQLSPRERVILMEHFGLNHSHPAKTLDQLGQSLGLSKERVRQIEIQALGKLRKMLHPQQSDLLA